MKNLLIFTDIGDDIDDALAITYLVQNTNHHICGIVLSHGDIEHRHREALALNNFFERPLRWIKGTSSPLTSESDEAFLTTLTQCIGGHEHLTIVCLAAATDLAKAMKHIPGFLEKIDHIHYQGTIVSHEDTHHPDLDSYNFKTDPEAIRYCLSHALPFSTITKHQAYAQPLRINEFLHFTDSVSLNAYLLSKARERQARFQKLDLPKWQQLYGGDPTILSYPYDLLVAKSV